MKQRSTLVTTVVLTAMITIIFVNFFSPFTIVEMVEMRKTGSVDEVRKFGKALNILNNNYYEDFDAGKVSDSALMALANGLGDPYTEYMNAKDGEDYHSSIEGNYVGIGIVITRNIDDNTVEVVSPFAGSPAYEAGIAPGDKIIKVDDEAVNADSLDLAASKMRGIEGTQVTIEVLKADSGNTTTLTLTRASISIETVDSKIMEDDVGYIDISQFTENTSKSFAKHYNELVEEGAKEFIIDLRSNPGGIVTEATSIADFFMDEGIITYLERKDGQKTKYMSHGNGLNVPIVILTNNGTASAGEILTGALHDVGRAYIIGEKSYGKGVVQQIWDFKDGGLLKATVAKYYTPNGVCIDKIGIEPDLTVEMATEDYYKNVRTENDKQLTAALEYLANN